MKKMLMFAVLTLLVGNAHAKWDNEVIGAAMADDKNVIALTSLTSKNCTSNQFVAEYVYPNNKKVQGCWTVGNNVVKIVWLKDGWSDSYYDFESFSFNPKWKARINEVIASGKANIQRQENARQQQEYVRQQQEMRMAMLPLALGSMMSSNRGSQNFGRAVMGLPPNPHIDCTTYSYGGGISSTSCD